MDNQATSFDLKAFQVERDEKRKVWRGWKPTVSDVLNAYTAGERDFASANLSDANLSDANLYSANLSDANLYGADGIKTVSPVGNNRRLIFAYIYDNEIRIQAGCRNGIPDEIRFAVEQDYDAGTDGYADYMDAIDLLEKWGKREIYRHANKE